MWFKNYENSDLYIAVEINFQQMKSTEHGYVIYI